MKYTFRTGFSSHAVYFSLLKVFLTAWTAGEGAMKPTLSVIVAEGAEGLGFLCCARLGA